MTDTQTVAAIADRYVDAVAAHDPATATYIGVPGHDHELPLLDPEWFEAGAALSRATLAELDAVDATDDRDRVAKAVMTERLGLQVEEHDAGLPYGSLNVIASDLQGLRQVFDLMDLSSDTGWGDARSRMAAIGASLDGLAATYREGVRRGIVPARRQAVECATQCEAWAGTGDGPGFFAALVEGSSTDGSLRKELDAAAAEAQAAFGRFGEFLRHEYAPACRETDPVGRERYAFGARAFTGAQLDLEATYAWGWEELARIDAQKRVTAERVVPGGSVADAVKALDADPARTLHGADALQAWMQELSDRTVADFDGVHFDIAEPIRRLDCKIAPPGGGAGAYYTPPSEDFSRAGTMWWSLSPGQDSFTTWKEVTTVFHEGVPGHHLQCAQVAYLADVLTRYQRLLLFVSGHGEGWALYAERLMEELGYLDDAGDKLGMLDAQAFRAVRVVLDIGMHLELEIPDNPWGFEVGERWTPSRALTFLQANTLLEPAYAKDEIDRYLGWPGQAISYKVGEKVWLEGRDAAKARHGSAFDLKAFHRTALDLGPMGLDPLRDELARI